MINNDPRATARHYSRNLPRFALAVDYPWFWPPLGLNSGVINVHFDCEYRGPLALVHRPQLFKAHERNDVAAIATIIRDNGGYFADAHLATRFEGHETCVVGIVEVTENTDEVQSVWFTGPRALVVENGLPLYRPHTCCIDVRGSDGLFPLDRAKLDAIAHSLGAVQFAR